MEFPQRINHTKNSNETGGWVKNSHNTPRGGAELLHSLDVRSSLNVRWVLGWFVCLCCCL